MVIYIVMGCFLFFFFLVFTPTDRPPLTPDPFIYRRIMVDVLFFYEVLNKIHWPSPAAAATAYSLNHARINEGACRTGDLNARRRQQSTWPAVPLIITHTQGGKDVDRDAHRAVGTRDKCFENNYDIITTLLTAR